MTRIQQIFHLAESINLKMKGMFRTHDSADYHNPCSTLNICITRLEAYVQDLFIYLFIWTRAIYSALHRLQTVLAAELQTQHSFHLDTQLDDFIKKAFIYQWWYIIDINDWHHWLTSMSMSFLVEGDHLSILKVRVRTGLSYKLP